MTPMSIHRLVAVGMTVGIGKRQPDRDSEPKDELDSLIDQLDDFDM